jgi:hypothetical protein
MDKELSWYRWSLIVGAKYNPNVDEVLERDEFITIIEYSREYFDKKKFKFSA